MEDLAAGEVGQRQQHGQQPASDRPRLDGAQRRVLVRDVSILELLQCLEVGGDAAGTSRGRAPRGFGAGRRTAARRRPARAGRRRRPAARGPGWRSSRSASRAASAPAASAPAGRCRLRPRPTRPARAGRAPFHPRASGRRGTRAASARCSALSSRTWRTVRPAQLTKLAAERRSRARIQAEQLPRVTEAFAMPEQPRQPRPRALGEIGEHLVLRPVAVADEDEAGLQSLRLDAMRAQVGLQGVVEQRQARKWSLSNCAERRGCRCAGRPSRAAAFIDSPGAHARPTSLPAATGATTRKWSCGVMPQNFRQKSIRRSLAQYTLPR